MAQIKFEVTIQTKLAELLPNMRKEIAKELYQFGEEVMTASKEVVPVKSGALMNTGKVGFPEETANEISVTLGYGDEAVGYAVYVHENLNSHVNWTRPGSGPKYLENPLKERQDKLPSRIADAIKRAAEDTASTGQQGSLF